MPIDNFQDIVGAVSPPPGVAEQIQDSGLASDQIAVMFFLNKIIVIVTVIAGIWVMVNLVMAGITYITSSGDAKAHTQVRDKLTMSLIGLVIIVAAYTLTAVVSLLFFGDATYVLNPTVLGPQP